MNRLTTSVILLLAACGDGGITAPQPPLVDGTEATVELVADDLSSPVFMTAPAGDDRLFIVEQPGRIRILREGVLVAAPFLDIQNRVAADGEQGLLGLAFHPDYASNGRFFVNYTDNDGNTRIEEFHVSADPDLADPGSGQVILAIDQPASNHNGGMLVFAPDGTLWIGTGDGGGVAARQNAQDLESLLGKILRIDVDGAAPYAIPDDNPFAGDADARGEVWAYGLRNPWRFSLDPSGDNVFIADVGQNAFEEVNRAEIGEGGLNYGWPVMEASHCFPDDPCDTDGLELPVHEYDHDEGCSITGGYVYRGSAMPDLVGHYFYGDYCGGWVRSFRVGETIVTDHQEWDFGSIGNVLSFAADEAGELYVLTRSGADGRVWQLVPGE